MTDEESRFGLGNVYMQTGKFRLAEYHFRKASQINPTNATLVCCVGSVRALLLPLLICTDVRVVGTGEVG